MSTPIPALVSQVIANGETLQVTTGTLQTLPSTRYYYLVSSTSTATNGQSLLTEIKAMLEASLAGTTWTVVLTLVSGLYKIQVSHNNGASRTITWSAAFAAALGFSSVTTVVATATTVTAAYPSYWWWTPDMPVSATGPQQFDPAVSYGIPESQGASQRSSDMTTAYVMNGTQWSAEYSFTGVQYLYKIRAQSGHTNEDFETWWQNGPDKGRLLLWWRSRDNATGSSAPSATASPGSYIEYAVQESLRGKLPATPMVPTNVVYWDVKLDLWKTNTAIVLDACRTLDIGYHTLIANTVGLWQFNNTMADTSGNALDLTVDVGSEQYADVATNGATTVTGFNFTNSSGNRLIAPATALLRISGDLTVEFLIQPLANSVQTYVQCEVAGSDLYAYYYGGLNGQAYADQTVNDYIGTFPPGAQQGALFRGHHFAMRRRTSGGNKIVEAFIDGVLQAGSLTTAAGVPAGNERLRVGGFLGGANLAAVMSSLRILNVARSNADIACDYNSTLGALYGYV